MGETFCSEISRSVQEDPIGTATSIETYILLESSLPWASNAWETPDLPIELQAAISQIKIQYPQTRTLLINQDDTRWRKQRTLLIYQRKKDSLVSQFDRYCVQD
jgi:hypothetical protein